MGRDGGAPGPGSGRAYPRAASGGEDVLDCSCGIGTQSIGLARLGYRVTGTDVSEVEVERARHEARRLGATASFGVADFRDLSRIEDRFDVVISCDNALPHLLDRATSGRLWVRCAQRLRLRRAARDHDARLRCRARRPRPPLAAPVVVSGPPRRVLVRLHDWDDDGPCYTVRYLVLTETPERWTVVEHTTRYRAITREELDAAARAAGFDEVPGRPTGRSSRPAGHDRGHAVAA